jgi:hypothetical protein
MKHVFMEMWRSIAGQPSVGRCDLHPTLPKGICPAMRLHTHTFATCRLQQLKVEEGADFYILIITLPKNILHQIAPLARPNNIVTSHALTRQETTHSTAFLTWKSLSRHSQTFKNHNSSIQRRMKKKLYETCRNLIFSGTCDAKIFF